MSDVPSDVLRDIFLRLPVESLLSLRRVCKQWLRTIDDSSDLFREILEIFVRLPEESMLRLRSRRKQWVSVIDHSSFIQHHTHKQHNSHTILLQTGSEGTLYSFPLASINFTNDSQIIDAVRIKRPIRCHWTLRIRSSCNGLILMDNYFSKTVREGLVVWNPLTDERRYFSLPKLINAAPGSCCYAFGYDCDADDYKVVILIDKSRGDDEDLQTHVYSLKSDSWRRIQDCPVRIHSVGGTFFNGALYWPSEDTKTIIALDLGPERFSELPMPPLVDRSDFNICTNFELDALDGCLICSLNYTASKTFHGWVMKDNGVEKSWVNFFSYYLPMFTGKLKIVAFLKGKRQVVLQHNTGFLWFDFGTNYVKKFSIDGFQGINYSQICPGSLVRLGVRNDAIERTKKRKTERRVTRLKFCVQDVRRISNFGRDRFDVWE